MAPGYDRFISESQSYVKMIEMPALMGMIGDISGKSILDLGCGSGIYSAEFAKKGAIVTGLDISEASLRLARSRAAGERLSIEFVRGSISGLGFFCDKKFDMIFSSTTMHYIKDIEGAFLKMNRLLNDKGILLLSVVHPFYTAQYPLSDYEGEDKYAVFQLRYFNKKLREYIPPWAKYGEGGDGHCLSYHHTIEDYYNALKMSGFCFDRIVEPQPLPVWKEKYPRRYFEMMNYPLFLIFKCLKDSGT